MNFVMHRNRTVSTARGHIIEFKKGEPTYVPPECYEDVIAVGATPEEELPDEPVAENAEPTDPGAREKAIFEAFEKLVTRNGREDFAASGAPNGKALNNILGFAVDSKERLTLWNKFQSEKGEA